MCDTGERYLSKLYSDEWMEENQMLESERVSARALLGTKDSSAPDLITVESGHTVRQALNLMSTYNVSQLPVVDAGDSVGSVTEGGLMELAFAEPAALDKPIQDVMEAPYPVIGGDFPLERFSTLLSRKTPAVLVRENGHLTGIVTRYDVLNHVAGIR